MSFSSRTLRTGSQSAPGSPASSTYWQPHMECPAGPGRLPRPALSGKNVRCCEQLAKPRPADGLDQVVVEPGVPRACQVLLLAVSREGDQHGPGPSEPLAELAGHLVTVHAREADVQQDHVEAVNRGRLDGRGTVVGDGYLVAPEPENLGEALRRVLTIVHDEEPKGLLAGLCRGRGRLVPAGQWAGLARDW